MWVIQETTLARAVRRTELVWLAVMVGDPWDNPGTICMDVRLTL